MTKLQIMNTFLTERLMAALDEIMDMVGGTVLQYEKELDSIQKDNEYLRRRLKETEKLIQCNGIANSEPASPSQQMKWSSCFEPETVSVPTEIYQNQVSSDQLTSTKVEELTDPGVHFSCPPIQDTPITTDQMFETSALKEFQCDVKVEPVENLDLESTNENTSIHSPLSHCTAQVSATDVSHRSDPNVFSISHSRTDLESASRMNSCSKLKPKSFQISVKKINPSVPKTTCPESGIAPINYSPPCQNTDSGSAKSRTHDAIGTNGHLSVANVVVSSPRHVPVSKESRQGSRREQGKSPMKHACPQCGKLFSHYSRLKVHMWIHTGEKPYACAQCGKRFNNDGTLRNHSRVHLQLRLFDCPVCSRSFKDAYTRRNHMRVHAKTGHAVSTLASKLNRT